MSESEDEESDDDEEEEDSELELKESEDELSESDDEDSNPEDDELSESEDVLSEDEEDQSLDSDEDESESELEESEGMNSDESLDDESESKLESEDSGIRVETSVCGDQSAIAPDFGWRMSVRSFALNVTPPANAGACDANHKGTRWLTSKTHGQAQWGRSAYGGLWRIQFGGLRNYLLVRNECTIGGMLRALQAKDLQ